MKRTFLLGLLILAHRQPVVAQDLSWEAIKDLTKKVLIAIDLKVQRLQTKTIWLQHFQKELENDLSKLKLQEIGDWVEKQRKLYADYYQELQQVKQVISGYEKVKRILDLQARIVTEYKTAFNLFKRDGHFTPAELDYMGKVYGGMLDESVKNVDQLGLVINAFVTQMDDAHRLEIIDGVARELERIYADLGRFNQGNIQLSLQRAFEKNDLQTTKKLYGLP